MYTRLIQLPARKSFFLFGPRGTGKSTWVQTAFPKAVYLDLLDAELYTRFLAAPNRLAQFIPEGFHDWVILDEIQRVPQLLNEVHRLIETAHLRFVLTGSSARSLRRRGVNLLGGRALTHTLYPLTSHELGRDFDLARYLKVGGLPAIYHEGHAKAYLESYVATYLREEIQQEGLTRNLSAFARFLEAASFSQASLLNVSSVARECAVERKVVEQYFGIVEDLLLGFRVPVLTKKAKRRMAEHPKFYFFDVGVYQTLRPRGPLDVGQEINGPALETLLVQELRAANAYAQLGYAFYYWRTSTQAEVDVVLYGPRGLHAFEVTLAKTVRQEDTRALKLFLADYPMAKAYLVYGGERRLHDGPIQILPITACLAALPDLLQ